MFSNVAYGLLSIWSILQGYFEIDALLQDIPFSQFCETYFQHGAWYAKGQKCVVAVPYDKTWDDAFFNCSKWPVEITLKAQPPFIGRLVTIQGMRKNFLRPNHKNNKALSEIEAIDEVSKEKTSKERQAEAIIKKKEKQAAEVINKLNDPIAYDWTYTQTGEERTACSWDTPKLDDGTKLEYWLGTKFSDPKEECVRIRGNLEPMQWWDVGCWDKYKYFCEFIQTTTTADSCEPEGVFIDQVCYVLPSNNKVTFDQAHRACLRRGGVIASFTKNCSREQLVDYVQSRFVDRFWVGMKRNVKKENKVEIRLDSKQSCDAKTVEVEGQSTAPVPTKPPPYDGAWLWDVKQGKLVASTSPFQVENYVCMIRDCAGAMDCGQHGVCTRGLTGLASCSCSNGWTGRYCQIKVVPPADEEDCYVDPCASDPCIYAIECITTELDTYWCECLPGYTGINCEIEIDECESEPCVNGATCNDWVNLYSCACSPGWSGSNCEIDINECVSTPCQNGAHCNDLINLFTCDCQPGYSGYLCEIDINECISDPCVNRGVCEDKIDDYFCFCVPAFAGKTCEIALTSCTWEMLEASFERTVMVAQQTSTSSMVIGCMLILICIFLLLCDFSYERMLHMIQEIVLMVAHICILLFRTPYLLDTAAFCDPTVKTDPVKISPFACTLQAIAFHYMFLVFFLLNTAEAIHNYCVYTYVTLDGKVISLWRLLVLCFGSPLILVGYTAARHFDTYSNENTCWIAIHSPNFLYFSFLPITFLMCVAWVTSEATGMDMARGEGDWPQLPFGDPAKRFTANANSKGGLLIPLLAYFAWFIGAMGVDSLSIPLYTASFFINLCLVTCIMIFHTLGNHRARTLIILIFWTLPKEQFGSIKECFFPYQRKKRKKRRVGQPRPEIVYPWYQRLPCGRLVCCCCCRPPNRLESDEEWAEPPPPPKVSIMKRIKETIKPTPLVEDIEIEIIEEPPKEPTPPPTPPPPPPPKIPTPPPPPSPSTTRSPSYTSTQLAVLQPKSLIDDDNLGRGIFKQGDRYIALLQGSTNKRHPNNRRTYRK